MANYYIDPAASGSNDGSSPANAWTSANAWTQSTPTAGDTVWIRRTVDYSVSSTLTPYTGGTNQSPTVAQGWPRGQHTGTGNWTNGSNQVTSVSDASIRRYVGRWIKNDAHGWWYLVTWVSGTTLYLDRPYAGDNASSAAFTVRADDDYAIRPQAGIDAGWDSDAQDLPRYYGNPTAQMLTLNSSAKGWVIKNLYFEKTGTATYSMAGIYAYSGRPHIRAFEGCIFYAPSVSAAFSLVYVDTNSWLDMNRFLISGYNHTNQYGLQVAQGYVSLRNGAVSASYQGIRVIGGTCHLENVNVGVESACTQDIWAYSGGVLTGKDVLCGNSLVYLKVVDAYPMINANLSAINIEAWGKDLSKVFRKDSLATSSMRVDTGTSPVKRSNGNDCILVVDLGTNNSDDWGPPAAYYKGAVFDQRIWQQGGTTQAFKVYLQSTVALSSGLVTLEATWIDNYESDTEYTETASMVTGAISERSDDSDWSQYLEVTGISPAVSMGVRLRLYVRAYSSSDFLYVDPKIEITYS